MANQGVKVCEQCDIEFIKNNSSRKFCSRKCSGNNRHIKSIESRKKECEYCDEIFVVPFSKPSQMFCSRECASSNKSLQSMKRRERICEYCSGYFVFPFNKPNQMYCSHKCYADATYPKIPNTVLQNVMNNYYLNCSQIARSMNIDSSRIIRIVNGNAPLTI